MPAAAGDELRPVTVLFADIVGSTSLGERLSPGEVKDVAGWTSRSASAGQHLVKEPTALNGTPRHSVHIEVGR